MSLTKIHKIRKKYNAEKEALDAWWVVKSKEIAKDESKYLGLSYEYQRKAGNLFGRMLSELNAVQIFPNDKKPQTMGEKLLDESPYKKYIKRNRE